MKKLSLITGFTALAAVAALWAAPVVTSSGVAAAYHANNRWFQSRPDEHFSDTNTNDNDSDDNGGSDTGDTGGKDGHGVPEPGMLALMALGLTGLGAAQLLHRRRAKA